MKSAGKIRPDERDHCVMVVSASKERRREQSTPKGKLSSSAHFSSAKTAPT